MNSWFVREGILSVRSHSGEESVPTAEEIFRYFKENDRSWASEPIDESEVANVRFSKYPLQLCLSLQKREGVDLLGITGTHRGKALEFSSVEILEAGHLVRDDRWYPLDTQSAAEIRKLLAKCNAQLGKQASLQMYLAMRQAGLGAAPNEGPLNALSFVAVSDATPKRVNAVLYPYQIDGWRWCRFIAAEGLGGILADEMGLGKTLQIIGAIADPLREPDEPVLIP